MSSNDIETTSPDRRGQIVRWVIRLAVALVISALLVLLFFTTGVVSH